MFPFSIPWTQRELQRDLPRLTTTLPWSHDLELHPDNFDAEHFRLVQGISALLMALSSRDSCRISMAYQVLVASARDHFASQEARMLAKAFGGLEEHSDEHLELARRLAEVRMSHFSPYGSASHLGALPFLERWLVPHLRFSDKRFTDFLAAHPPAPGEPAGQPSRMPAAVPCLELTNTRTPDFETEPKSGRDQSFNPTGLVLGDKGPPVEIAQGWTTPWFGDRYRRGSTRSPCKRHFRPDGTGCQGV